MPREAASIKPVRRSHSGLETRAAILASAERHFAERGFEAARLEDIAADVGIRRAAIFYYFRDKHELYAAVLDEVFGGALAQLSSAGGSAAERLESSLVGWIDYVAARPTVARLILREAASVQPGVASHLVRAAGAPVEWVRAVIDEGVASGELKPIVDPHRFISLLGANTVFHFAAMPWIGPGDLPDPWSGAELEKHKREIVRVVRAMLGIASPPRAGSN